MRDYALFSEKRRLVAKDILIQLEKVFLENEDDFTIKELLEKIDEPLTSITAREAIWKLIDQDRVELTPDRKFRRTTVE